MVVRATAWGPVADSAEHLRVLLELRLLPRLVILPGRLPKVLPVLVLRQLPILSVLVLRLLLRLVLALRSSGAALVIAAGLPVVRPLECWVLARAVWP